MSKIKELIKELCPNGVTYQTIETVCDFQNGYAFKSNLFKDDGDILLRITNIDGNKIDLSDIKYINISDYNTNLSPFKVNNDDIVIAMSGATTGKIGINHTNKILYLNQRVGKITPKDSRLNNHFLYHYLLSKVNYFYQLAGGGAQPNLSSEAIKNTLIPLPPLEVQEEIVKILDKFGELEVELEVELELRRKQYEFWCEKIFNNDDNLMAIGDLLESKGYIRGPFGSALVKADMVSEGIPVYEQQHAIYNHRDFRYFITLEKAKKLERFSIEPDDLIISCSGTVGKVSVILDNDPKGIINQALLILRLNKNLIMPKYMKYYLESPIGYRSITANTNKSAQVNIASRDAIEKIMIPVPSLEEQKRIVDILDTFDALVNDIPEGLPAEIKLRRQQYEYYRNKLLSFEEV